MSDWTAVTPQTMPDVGACVLASCATAVRIVQWRGNGWTTVPGGWSAKVTHWMPLPAPPA